MSVSALNWASPDQTKNMTLADADHLGNQLAASLCLQIAEKHVVTTTGETVSEAELRGNQFISPLPVNLYGELVGGTRTVFNLADFRTSLKSAAAADDPYSAFAAIVQSALPGANPSDMITRIPAVQHLVSQALSQF